MNSNRPHLSSQVGASGTSLRQRKGISVSGENNDSSTSGGNEIIVQKLQGVLFAVRRDRDREHRSRDIALEKLRTAKEVFQKEKSSHDVEKEKLTKTRDEAERTQKEISRKEETIQQLQQKYEFQHEDLIRNRAKIEQQNSSLETTAFHRSKSVLDAQRRLDRQRNKYQEIKRIEDQEFEKFLATIMSLARGKNKTSTPQEANAIANAQSGNGIREESIDEKKSQFSTNDLDEFFEALEKRKEESLIREFKTNIDYAMLPKMISQKAEALEAENEIMRNEITRLEGMLHGTGKSNFREDQE